MKKLIKAYKKLESIAEEIYDYIVNVDYRILTKYRGYLSYRGFDIDDDNLSIVYTDDYEGNDKFVMDIPIDMIENNRWKDYINEKHNNLVHADEADKQAKEQEEYENYLKLKEKFEK